MRISNRTVTFVDRSSVAAPNRFRVVLVWAIIFVRLHHIPSSAGFYLHLTGCQGILCRYTLNFNISPQAKDQLDQLLERTGLPQNELCTRVFEWLSNQPPLVQVVVLGQIPQSDVPDILNLIRAKQQNPSTPDLNAQPVIRLSNQDIPGKKTKRTLD